MPVAASDSLRVFFVNVGQADSTVVVTWSASMTCDRGLLHHLHAVRFHRCQALGAFPNSVLDVFRHGALPYAGAGIEPTAANFMRPASPPRLFPLCPGRSREPTSRTGQKKKAVRMCGPTRPSVLWLRAGDQPERRASWLSNTPRHSSGSGLHKRSQSLRTDCATYGILGHETNVVVSAPCRCLRRVRCPLVPTEDGKKASSESG